MPGAPLRLRCEFAGNPLGVTRRHPRLSWWVNDNNPAEVQTAYEILAASSEDILSADQADVWHSGRVESDRCSHVAFGTTGLAPGQRVWWKVRTYDSDGMPSPWSENAAFQAGPTDTAHWHGQWIASRLRGSRSRGVHAVALRREFVLAAPIRSASLFVCALGDYRMEINGRQVTGADCNAAWSDFDAQAYYQSYDVAHLLKAEPNCIGVLLADGYYAGVLPGVGRANYGTRPQLLLQLDVQLASGESFSVISDEQWLWSPSWVLAADINLGEHQDAGQYIEGWSEPGLDTRGWLPVDVVPLSPRLQLLSQPHPGFAVRQLLQPVGHPRKLRQGRQHVCVYDFGEAIVGRVQLQLTSSQPDEVTLCYSLDERFDDATEDTFTSAGGDTGEVFRGLFALHAFRYLRVTYGAEITTLADMHALRLAPTETPSLLFNSDHPSLNNLFHALQSSLVHVAQGVPMRGLTAAQRWPDAAYAATWVPFYAQQVHTRTLVNKWIADLRHAFNHGVGERMGEAQAVASASVPRLARLALAADEYAHFETLVRTVWVLYRFHNDLDLLRECYGELRVAALSYKHAHGDFIRSRPAVQLYGEAPWSELVATACMHGVLRTTARIAGVLGHLGDYELLEALADDTRKAFRRRYLSQDGHLPGDSQSVYVAALYHQLLDEPERHAAQNRLVALLQQKHYHADVAPVLMHALLPALTDAGRLDIAYMVLLQTSAPGWLACINQHPGFIGQHPGEFDIASVGIWEWLLESLVGLRLHEDYSVDMNGYRRVRIQPMPPFGAQFLAGSPVRFVEASLQTVHGQYEIKWSITQDGFELDLLIPPSCEGLVTMPDGIEQQVQSGHHRFVMDFGAGGDGVPTLLELAGGAS